MVKHLSMGNVSLPCLTTGGKLSLGPGFPWPSPYGIHSSFDVTGMMGIGWRQRGKYPMADHFRCGARAGGSEDWWLNISGP